jgi:hypothetical protein
MDFKQDQEITELAEKKDYDELSDAADSGCTRGYDNDGSTGYEIFMNGFELAQKAGKKPIFVIPLDPDVFFFIGTKKSVLKRIHKLRDSRD